MTLTPEREAEIREKLKSAREMVHALCQPRGTAGAREWVMTIPARRGYDPDLVIADALDEIEPLLAALDAERARAEKAERLSSELYDERDECLNLATKMRVRAQTAERERDEARQMHAECAATHGSTYGMDWRQWQLANDALKSAEARERKLREAARGLACLPELLDGAAWPAPDSRWQILRQHAVVLRALLSEEPKP